MKLVAMLFFRQSATFTEDIFSLIIFLSDHGDYTGDYSVTEKSQNSFEDCVVRVPLLIKPPVWEKTDPGISDAMTELVDFFNSRHNLSNCSSTFLHIAR